MRSKSTSSSSSTNKVDKNDIPKNAKSDQKSDEKKTDPRLCRSRSRLDKFLLPSTKSKDILSEAENGRPLRNRRVLTLILLERSHEKLLQRTFNRFIVSSTDTQTQTSPKGLKNPSLWLVASRWVFLPKSKSEVKNRLYKCPKDIKKKLEEDISNINKEPIKDLTDSELFEFYEYLNKLATRKSKSSKIPKLPLSLSLSFSFDFAMTRIQTIPHLFRVLVPTLIDWIKSKCHDGTPFQSMV